MLLHFIVFLRFIPFFVYENQASYGPLSRLVQGTMTFVETGIRAFPILGSFLAILLSLWFCILCNQKRPNQAPTPGGWRIVGTCGGGGGASGGPGRSRIRPEFAELNTVHSSGTFLVLNRDSFGPVLLGQGVQFKLYLTRQSGFSTSPDAVFSPHNSHPPGRVSLVCRPPKKQFRSLENALEAH